MNDQQKKDQDEVPSVNREGWSADEINAESTNKPADETVREILRGGGSKGDTDNRDIAGSIDSDETPQGREENKKQETRSES